MTHPHRKRFHNPLTRRVARMVAVIAVPFATLAGSPVARAAEPLSISLEDGLRYRGDGWTASLGTTLAVDSGQELDRPGGVPSDADTVLRRFRPSLSLSLSPQWSARVEYEFGDVGPGFKNAWVQWRPTSKLSVRLGSQFAPFGLENTMSSREMSATERSATSALTAAALAGISVRLHDDRWSLSGGLYGNDVSDDDRRRFAGESAIARVTVLPLRRDGWLWHLGASAEYRQGERDGSLRLRARPETFVTEKRLVDTGVLPGVDTLTTVGLETAVRRGPVLVQAEYLRATAKRDALVGADGVFDGSYISASWFVTGERRNYSESGGVFSGIEPKRDWGAVELTLRASRLDLEDGPITGGEQDVLSTGVNWYFNSYGRVSLGYTQAEARRAGIDSERKYVTLRAQIAF